MNRVLPILLLLTNFLFANHNQHLFENANNLYEQGKYSEAIQQFEEIISNGYESWEVYYNLGNAYFKNNQVGKSILNYERALQLSNKNEDVKFNLDLADSLVIDKIQAPQQFILFKIWNTFKNYFSLNMISFIVLILYIVLTISIVLRILIPKRAIRAFTKLLIIPSLVLVIIFSITLTSRIYDHKNLKFGIILNEEIIVKGSPEDSGTELFTLHEGVKVQVQRQVNNWLQIRLTDGKVGWVKQDVLEII